MVKIPNEVYEIRKAAHGLQTSDLDYGAPRGRAQVTCLAQAFRQWDEPDKPKRGSKEREGLPTLVSDRIY